MIELISILCSLVLCIVTPIEVNRIRNGWVRKNFAGDREKFLAAYRRQLVMLTWLGIVFALLSIGLAFISIRPGDWIVKLVAGAIWLAVACIAFVSRRLLRGAGMAGSLSGSST